MKKPGLICDAEKFGLEPKEVDGELVLSCNRKAKKAPKLNMTLKAWHTQIEAVQTGAITQEDFALWKAEFGRD